MKILSCLATLVIKWWCKDQQVMVFRATCSDLDVAVRSVHSADDADVLLWM